MKKIFFLVMLSVLSLSAMAQYAEDTENGIVSLAGKEGFTLKSKKGDFVFKPYLLVHGFCHTLCRIGIYGKSIWEIDL